MKEIAIEELKLGECLSKDIYNDLGNIILAQGTELHAKHLEYFRNHGINFVYVEEQISHNQTADISRVITSSKYRELNSGYAIVLESFKRMYYQVQNKDFQFDMKTIEEDIKPLVDILLSDNDILGSMRLLSFKESYHFTHAVNVSMFGAMLGKWLGLDKQTIYTIATAGLLHDIGKTQVPQEILFKTDRLSLAELDLVRSHAKLGYELLKENAAIPRDVLAAILFHHERSDGSGYPSGLKEEQTPFIARIIGVVDVFDAITSDRIYKKGVSSFRAFNILKDESFRGLDPTISDVFMSNIASFFINNRVKLNDGRVGEVVYVNKFALNRPLIKIKDSFIDLSSDYTLDIEEVLTHQH
ncbi:HD-GYP domain-containing protein [Fusibacter bizertensis]|uniref:HD-GYP domain-containing protein n=1 Tax=Fusibacter bizertensis TaxID=1488331 RepID=A0ABT6N9T0_9FIRM|nr:HD-GYP domain-containing protein [Fusibacter bizertensis]MDH8677170.1 HD-GYP domain-containing protein [Fusibacter bizertensis]